MSKLPSPLYRTHLGEAYVGDARELLDRLESESVDLAITSPPFPLQRKKEYGNVEQDEYVDWLLEFTSKIKRVIKPDGSFVLDIGGAYLRGRPVRSLHSFRLIVRMSDEQGWKLAEEFFWFNPSKLPSPIEWVNKRKIRVKDAVNTVWWVSKTDFPRADVTKVLAPYSDRMKMLLKKKDKYYTPKKRPSGHDISEKFTKDRGGAIPPNLLKIPNTESNSKYLQFCKALDLRAHPARFPSRLPAFFIDFLTRPGDVVLDIFAGSNTTGDTAERLGRRWIALELDRSYLTASAFRFVDSANQSAVEELYERLNEDGAEDIIIPQTVQMPIQDGGA